MCFIEKVTAIGRVTAIGYRPAIGCDIYAGKKKKKSQLAKAECIEKYKQTNKQGCSINFFFELTSLNLVRKYDNAFLSQRSQKVNSVHGQRQGPHRFQSWHPNFPQHSNSSCCSRRQTWYSTLDCDGAHHSGAILRWGENQDMPIGQLKANRIGVNGFTPGILRPLAGSSLYTMGKTWCYPRLRW